MRSFCLTLIVIHLCINQSFTQQAKAWNNWHFGWFASMTFDSGTPAETLGSDMISEEGSASYSDDNGQLLFYTNGGKGSDANSPVPGAVWNRNHQIMPNGNLVYNAGCSSSPQSALIIPKGGITPQYYLYTMGCASSMSGLRESIIDMSLDNGLGDVTQIGTQISSTTALSEGLTATRHANGTDYWIITHDMGNEFYVYPHTVAGIGIPATYSLGNGIDIYGQIKISAAGNVLAFGQEVFDFNTATGAITNPRSIGRSAWGRSFSPSGRYLYVSGALGVGNIYQYDLQATNLAASEIELAGGGIFSGPMQLGPDGKIYVCIYGQQSVSVINSPESPGTASNLVLYQVPLTHSAQLGMPNFIDSYYYYLQNTSVSKNENSFSFDLYPNPASSNFTVKSDVTIHTVCICSITGTVLKTIDSNAFSTEIDVTDLSSGTYFVIVDSEKGRSIKELIVD